MATAKRTTLDRFWAKVQKAGTDDCWVWIGARSGHGYGIFGASGTGVTRCASRLSYQFHHGVTVPRGLEVMHSCDNPPCVNPAHLSIGTRRDNQQDSITKGRRPTTNIKNRGDGNGMRRKPWTRPIGERHPMRKLSAQDASDIRAAYACGETGTVIAKRYAVRFQQIYRIISRERWK